MGWNEERKEIFKKIDDLDNVIHILEATANTYYSVDDKMWNILLKSRDKLKIPIEKEKSNLFAVVTKNDKKEVKRDDNESKNDKKSTQTEFNKISKTS